MFATTVILGFVLGYILYGVMFMVHENLDLKAQKDLELKTVKMTAEYIKGEYGEEALNHYKRYIITRLKEE